MLSAQARRAEQRGHQWVPACRRIAWAEGKAGAVGFGQRREESLLHEPVGSQLVQRPIEAAGALPDRMRSKHAGIEQFGNVVAG